MLGYRSKFNAASVEQVSFGNKFINCMGSIFFIFNNRILSDILTGFPESKFF